MTPVVIIFALLCFPIQIYCQTGRCSTSRKEQGTCVNIKRCPYMLNLLRTDRNNPATVDYLKSYDPKWVRHPMKGTHFMYKDMWNVGILEKYSLGLGCRCVFSPKDYPALPTSQLSICGYDGSDPVICCPSDKGGNPTQTRPTQQPPKESQLNNRLLPSPPKCGKSLVLDHERIVGGSPAELGAWPWIAALGYRSRTSSNIKFLCGGALINRRYVVTAAHCTRHPTATLFAVRLGDLNLETGVKDGASPVDIRIERVIPHEAYSEKEHSDDIALLRLQEDVQFTDHIQPICLPITTQLRSNNFLSKSPFIAGWGSTSFKGPSATALQEAQIEVVPNDGCNRAYNTKGATITNKHLCAGNVTGGIDACQGDSGGPLMLPVGLDFYLIGVVSYGYKCAEPGFPGVYARVTEYVDWLNKNMQP